MRTFTALLLAAAATGAAAAVVPPACLASLLGLNASATATGALRAESARLFSTRGIAVGVTGSLFTSDASQSAVNVLTDSGWLSRFAGDGIVGWTQGPALTARVSIPNGLAVTADNSVLLLEPIAGAVRLVRSSDAVIVPLIGTGVPVGTTVFTDGGRGVDARVRRPRGLSVDAFGRVYVGTGDCVLLSVNIATGILRRISGAVRTCAYAGDGGPAANATLLPVRGTAATPDGRWVFVSDSASTVRVVAMAPPGGGPPTIHGVLGAPPPAAAPFGFIPVLAYDAGGAGGGTLYFSSLQRLAVFSLDVGAVVNALSTSPAGLPATFAPLLPPAVHVAGDGRFGSLGNGGPLASASFGVPSCLALWPNPLHAWIAASGGGNASATALRPATRLYIAEFVGALRVIDLAPGDGSVRHVMGAQPLLPGQAQSAASAFAEAAADIAWAGGRLYVSRTAAGSYIWAVDPGSTWAVTPAAGTGESARGADGSALTSPLHFHVTGLRVDDPASFCNKWSYLLTPWPPAVQAQQAQARATVIPPLLLLAESFEGRVRVYDAAAGTLTTLIGNGGDVVNGTTLATAASGGTPALATAIGFTVGAWAVPGTGDAAGGPASWDVVFVYGASNFNPLCSVNGTPPDLRDSNRALGFYDGRTGRVSHFACDRVHGGVPGSGPDDGPAAAAHCCEVRWAAPLWNGDVVFSDKCDHSLRVVFAGNGSIATLAGRRGAPGFGGDGGPARAALLSLPGQLSLAPDGVTLIFMDEGNARIRAIDLSGGLAAATIYTVIGDGFVWDEGLLSRAPGTPPSALGIGTPTNDGTFVNTATVSCWTCGRGWVVGAAAARHLRARACSLCLPSLPPCWFSPTTRAERVHSGA